MSLRVTLLISAPAAVAPVIDIVQSSGHQPVALVSFRAPAARYLGSDQHEPVIAPPPDLDTITVVSPARLGALLAATAADVGLCATFPARIPTNGLRAFPRGIVNIHPSLLPRYRGPNPIGWALRNGDEEIGMSAHYMDADFDTGSLLARASLPLDSSDAEPAILAKLLELLRRVIPRALARAEAGDAGEPQPSDGVTRAPFFGPEYLEVDWSRSAREVHAQVLAWRLGSVGRGARGPFAQLDGARVRLLKTRLDDSEGGIRVDCGDGPLWVLASEPAG